MARSNTVTVYTPDSSLARPGALAAAMARDLGAAREMAWQLAVRDIRAQYRQALLGAFWAILSPLLTAITWIFLRSSGIVGVSVAELPYPIFVFTGTILWSILVDAMNAPLAQTAAAASLLGKLNFPREAILLSALYQMLFHSGVKSVLLVGAIAIAGIRPGWGLLLFPLGVLALIVAGFAVGLVLTPLGMLYTDIRRALPLVMGFVMYTAPVVFPVPRTGWAKALFAYNPLSPLLISARGWLTGIATGSPSYLAAVVASSIVLLVFAWVAYRLAIPILIERLSA